MRSIILLAIISMFMYACGGGTTTGASADLAGYESENVSGTNITKAIKKNANGEIIEKGFVSNGKRNGMWISYWDGDNTGKIKTIASYTDGMLNGPYLELSNRGQIEKEVNYLKNQYDGKFIQYKYGRMEKEINYKGNELNGPSIDYDNKGNKQKVQNFKNGKLHGKWQTFNEEGELTLEYEYKNGEKVSGGIVN